jgi:hypothetical protein
MRGAEATLEEGGCFPFLHVIKKSCQGPLFAMTPVLYPFHRLQSEPELFFYQTIQGCFHDRASARALYKKAFVGFHSIPFVCSSLACWRLFWRAMVDDSSILPSRAIQSRTRERFF